MKHLAAYMLLTLGGNTSPSADDIKEVLSAAGIDADEERLTSLLGELEGKDINEVRRELQYDAHRTKLWALGDEIADPRYS